jgi:dTDP-4-dehydrorhamnose reductase
VDREGLIRPFDADVWIAPADTSIDCRLVLCGDLVRDGSAVTPAETAAGLVDIGATGLVHVTNGGAGTWCELAKAALEVAAVHGDLQPVSSEQWEATPWPDALRSFLADSAS